MFGSGSESAAGDSAVEEPERWAGAPLAQPLLRPRHAGHTRPGHSGRHRAPARLGQVEAGLGQAAAGRGQIAAGLGQIAAGLGQAAAGLGQVATVSPYNGLAVTSQSSSFVLLM